MPRSKPGLYRRPDSPFFWACYLDPAGHVVNKSTGHRDHAAARLWLASREREHASAELGLPVARQVSLAVALSEYLAERDLADKWAGTVEGFCRNEVIPHFGPDIALGAISEADVLAFRAEQKGRPDRRFKPRPGEPAKTISPATVNRLFWALAAFGRWAIRRGYALENPWRVDSQPEDDIAVPEVDPATWARFLLALPAPVRSLAEVARETGLRKGELGRLAWADIDMGERVGYVVSSHQRGRTKARRGRPFALSQRATAVLEVMPRRPDGLVFGPIGDHRRALKTAARAAGLDRAWMHLFRHLGATAFARSGAGLPDLKAFGGWSSSRMLDRYTRATATRLRELLDRGEKGYARDTDKKKGNPPAGIPL